MMRKELDATIVSPTLHWKPYPAYKDSGVEWLGDIPEHWEARRLKYISSCNDAVLPETTAPDSDLLYVDIGNVDPNAGILKKDPLRFESAPSRARRRVRHGDVIVSTVRTYLRAIVPITHPEPNLIVSTGFAVIRPKDGLIPTFAAYALRAPYFVDAIVARSVGVSYPAINAGDLIALPIALPSILEQRAIAAFLDRETARIDALIEKKQRQIELLQEKRAAVISHAVTRGLDPKAKMKDSGIEWLGDIPEHWEVWKVTHGFRYLGSGTTPKSDDLNYYDGQVPWVTTSELRENVIEDTLNKLTDTALRDYSALHIYPVGTLLFAMYGATIGRMGFLGIPATVNQACAAFAEPIALDAKFTYYWLWMHRPTLIAFSAGGGQPNLSQQDLRQIRIPAPSIDEQRSIAAFLDRETARIDALIGKIEKSIELLRKYRSALISAAVTGKIDVREEAAAC